MRFFVDIGEIATVLAPLVVVLGSLYLLGRLLRYLLTPPAALKPLCGCCQKCGAPAAKKNTGCCPSNVGKIVNV